MKKAFYIIAALGLVASYVNSYSKVYAQTHEKDEDTKFMFPAACHYGQDCWAVNYVDVDPTEGAEDFKCGLKTYDDHKGTDFALSSFGQMREGINVLAAAAGKVTRIRDGESDTLKSEVELEAVKEAKKECGNGVLIDHGEGLQTIYCHLKENSIVVKPKQRVRAGQKIAQIGHSGFAEFPHLHFGVFKDGKTIDPYTGASSTEGCGRKDGSMWHMGLPMNYEDVVIFSGGFRGGSPNFSAIERGDDTNPGALSLDSAALVFWVGFYNVEAGDEVTLNVYDPDGQLFSTRTLGVKKTRARQYYYTGRKVGQVELKKGVYRGRMALSRSGRRAVSKVKEFSVRVE